MAGREAYRYGAVEAPSASVLQCLTYTIITFNIIFAILGATMLALGFWITLDSDFKRWVHDLDMEHFWTGVYILMGAGVLVMLEAFFGICGAFQRKKTMLIVFVILMAICFLLELAGAGYMMANGTRHSRIESWLTHRFFYLIDAFNHDQQSARIMNIIQEWVGCCGAYGVLDYVKWNKVIPYTCYNPVTGNAWYMNGYGYMGCVRAFTMYLETRAGWIAGVAFVLAFLQIFATLAAVCLIKIKYDYQKAQDYNR